MHIYSFLSKNPAKSCEIKEETERDKEEKNEGQKSFFHISVTTIWKNLFNFAAYFDKRG